MRGRGAAVLAFGALTAASGLLAPDASAQGSVATDRTALEAIYHATGGASWTHSTNWLSDAPLDQWVGVETNARGRVTGLNLGFITRGNNLRGELPRELGTLSQLEVLYLHDNALSGPIPPELGRLSNLRELHLYDNALSGPIPPELGRLSNLRVLHLYDNALSGPIPPELGRLSNLRELHLFRNELSGRIPAELGRLSNLQHLSLADNALSGPIPPELGRLSKLQSLSLVDNALNGPIPAELGDLESLQGLSLYYNELTGPIPAELGNLGNLRWMFLTSNSDLSGPLPQSLMQLSELESLHIDDTGVCVPDEAAFQAWLAAIPDFRSSGFICGDLATDRAVLEVLYDATGGPSWTNGTNWKTSAPLRDWYGVITGNGRVTGLVLGDNGLTGEIPIELGSLVRLDFLDLFGNALTGSIPAELGDLVNLHDLYLDANALTGSIPAELGNLVNLHYLYLAGNALTGSIPAELGNLVNLRWLSVDSNELTGPIPVELGSLANLETLSVDSNELTGPIPAELGSLANLETLSVDSNELTGPIPVELGSLANLQTLSVDSNELTGRIPAELGSLANLETLSVDSNELTGPIPAELGSLANLETLSLGSNELTGPIPAELGSLANLQLLDVSSNALTGPIPAELGSLVNLERLDLSYSWGLSGSLPAGLERSRLENLDIFVTGVCTPTRWRGWLATIDFRGRLCETGTDVSVDVAVVYTPAAREAAGGATAIEAVIDLMIAETNQANETSGVHHRLALVDRSEVAYVETGETLLDVERLANPTDGHMDDVHALRDRVGADLVHLLLFEDVDFAGGAYVGDPFGATCQSCGGGVFAHELGHNMGLFHDRYQAHTYDGGTGRRLGAHPAYGYVNQRAFDAGAPPSSRWRTVMSYERHCADANVPPCSRLLRFSNPRQVYNADRLGIPYDEGGSTLAGPADATAVLNTTGPAVALWRDRPGRANRAPTAVGTLPGRRLPVRGMLDMDVSQAFVDPDGDTLTYAVASSAPRVLTASATGARLTLTAVGVGTATIRVTATDPGGLSASQSFVATVTVTVPFTDDPIRPGVTPIKAIHFTELRMRIDVLRSATGLARFPWMDPILRAGATPVRLAHLLELRSALAEAYTAAGRAAPGWTAAAGATPIRAAHMTELRAAVLELE